jgi:hypothetical protein
LALWVKNKNGDLEFTADHVIVGKVKETGIKELSATSISDGLLTTYETLKPKAEKSPDQKSSSSCSSQQQPLQRSFGSVMRLNQPNALVPTETAQEIAPTITDTTRNVSAIDTATTAKDPLPKISRQ